MPVIGIAGNSLSRNKIGVKNTKVSRKIKRTTKVKKTVAQISIEYNQWRKTPACKRWRRKQWARQAGLCFYCTVDLRDIKVNIEHVIPRSKGGTNDKKNLVLACSSCNKDKGSSKPDDTIITEAKKLSKVKPSYYEDNDPFYNELSWLRYE